MGEHTSHIRNGIRGRSSLYTSASSASCSLKPAVKCNLQQNQQLPLDTRSCSAYTICRQTHDRKPEWMKSRTNASGMMTARAKVHSGTIGFNQPNMPHSARCPHPKFMTRMSRGDAAASMRGRPMSRMRAKLSLR